MARRFVESLAPGIHAMTPDEKAMDTGIFLNEARGVGGKQLQVLAILQNGNEFAVLVRPDAVEAFEHLVAFDKKATAAEVVIRKDGAPNRMGMQHRAGSKPANNGQMQERFSGRLAFKRFHDLAVGIDFQNVIRREPALVDRAGGDGQSQRIGLDHHAEIAAGSENPSAAMEIASEFCQVRHGVPNYNRRSGPR